MVVPHRQLIMSFLATLNFSFQCIPIVQLLACQPSRISSGLCLQCSTKRFCEFNSIQRRGERGSGGEGVGHSPLKLNDVELKQ